MGLTGHWPGGFETVFKQIYVHIRGDAHALNKMSMYMRAVFDSIVVGRVPSIQRCEEPCLPDAQKLNFFGQGVGSLPTPGVAWDLQGFEVTLVA